MPSSCNSHKISTSIFILIQIVIIGFYTVLPLNIIFNVKHFQTPKQDNLHQQYIWISLTAVIGFGLITAISRNLFYFSLAFIPFIYAFTFELYFLFDGLFWGAMQENTDKFWITTQGMVNAGQAAIAMIICYGVVVGRVSSFAIFYICLVGVAGYTFLKTFIYQSLGAFDTGKGLIIHTYGACYGIVISYFMSKSGEGEKKKQKRENSFFYQHVAALGFVFLFILFPLLNSVADNETLECKICPLRAKKNHEHQRIIIIFNTVFALFGSTSAALLLTWTHKIKFNQIIYSGLAGGVISACIVNFIPYHIVFFVFGFFGALITKFCMEYLTPFLNRYGIEDGRWSLSMHGLPGVLSSIFSILLASLQVYMKYENYEEFLSVFPFPKQRFGSEQALYQFLALVFTLFMSLIAGFTAAALITGFLPGLEEEGTDMEEFQIPDKQYFQPFPVETIDDLEYQIKYGILH